MSNLSITPATSETDLDAVCELCWEYRAYLIERSPRERKVVETFYPEDKYAALMDTLAEYHARPKGIILLAKLNGQPVGCGMSYEIFPETAEIKRVYVRDAARGHGAGRQLCEALIDQARIDGHRRVVLDTSVSLTEARRLYDKLGFRERGPFYEVPPLAEGIICFYELDL